MHKFCIMWLIMLRISWGEVSYEGYKLFNIWPQNEDIKSQLLNLMRVRPDFYDLWKLHRGLVSSMSVSVAPAGLDELSSFLHHYNTTHEITIPDIMEAVNVEKKWHDLMRRRRMQRTMWKSVHDSYRTVDEINKALDLYAKKFPFINLENLGNTSEGRPIFALRISKNDTRPLIWIDAGIHAREWIAPASVLYLIDKLLTRGGQSLLEKHQFLIVPLVNPDGYDYTHKTARLWRKNRSKIPGEPCVGVDLNRNFPLKWGTGAGNSPDACDETFRGVEPASELESKALIRRMNDLKGEIILYLNLHSYGQYILTPYGFMRYHYPKNYPNMMRLAKMVRDKIQERHQYVYQIGSASDLLYEASGGVDDYVAGVLNVPYTFTIELCDEGRYGFLLPPSYIRPVGEQLWTAIKVFSKNI